MFYQNSIRQLQQNKTVFQQLLEGISAEEYRWKPQPEKWCLLEVICHLYDEEREDFRTRVRYSLETPDLAPPAIDPVGWVTERKYFEQDFDSMLAKFLHEREVSVLWLQSLREPNWESPSQSRNGIPRSAHFYLSNWLAHDFLHIRQITKSKYDYLKLVSGEPLDYAGNWI